MPNEKVIGKYSMFLAWGDSFVFEVVLEVGTRCLKLKAVITRY